MKTIFNLTLTLLLALCCLGCSDDMVSPTLVNLEDISELTPDKIEYLTYKQVLTDAMYTSQKLKDAVDSGMFLNRFTKEGGSTYHWFDFEPRLGGTGAAAPPEEEYALKFCIIVNNIEKKSPLGWHDEFAVLHTGWTDHPYFSPPVSGVIIDRETRHVLSSFRFFQEGAENRQDIPYPEFENTGLTGKALWEEQSKFFSVICAAPCVFEIKALSLGNWDEKTEIIDTLLARSVIRIRLENDMLFDYDFLELFPNPVVIDEWSHTNSVYSPDFTATP